MGSSWIVDLSLNSTTYGHEGAKWNTRLGSVEASGKSDHSGEQSGEFGQLAYTQNESYF